jgi:hypothetical protein
MAEISSTRFLPDRRIAAIAAGFAVILAAALLLRFGLLENPALDEACGGGLRPPTTVDWCVLRPALADLLHRSATGPVSLAFGLAAYLFRLRWAAVVALLCGTAGLVLYNQDYGAIGGLLGLMALAELGAVRR